MIIICKSCPSIFRLDGLLIKPIRLDGLLIKPTGSKVRCSNCGEVFKVFPPNAAEKRKYQRVKTQNLISYFSLDETGKLISRGLGIAMDISKGGILLQTTDAIESKMVALAAINRNKNLLEVRGELAYSKKSTIGTFFSGIKFVDSDECVTKFIVNLIKEYNFHGYNLYIRLHNEVPQVVPQIPEVAIGKVITEG